MFKFVGGWGGSVGCVCDLVTENKHDGDEDDDDDTATTRRDKIHKFVRDVACI